jgi:hypothetical protein
VTEVIVIAASVDKVGKVGKEKYVCGRHTDLGG